MAEFATPSAAAVATSGAAPVVEKTKPEKPDEEAYSVALKKAEKEHADCMAKYVSHYIISHYPITNTTPSSASRQTA